MSESKIRFFSNFFELVMFFILAQHQMGNSDEKDCDVENGRSNQSAQICILLFFFEFFLTHENCNEYKTVDKKGQKSN